MSVSIATGPRHGVSLREILPDAEFLGTHDLTIRSCAGELRECQRDDLFVAIVGAERDGHEDVLQAIKRGAIGIVTERLLPVNVPQCLVSDSRVAYGQICQALAGQPSARIKTISVGGTDGKTTTAHLIQSIYKTAGVDAAIHSSIRSEPKSSSRPTQRLTPPILAQSLAKMVMKHHPVAVIETGSVPLAKHVFAGTQVDVAVITNLRGHHFDVHQTLKNYRRAEFRILDYLKEDGVAVLNADDPGTYFALENITRPTLTVGIKQEANIRAKIIKSSLHETTFTIRAGDETVLIRTRIPGQHHIYNCLLAAATALLQGIDLPTIARGLENVESLPGRMKHVQCGQPYPVVVDEANTPYRLGGALNTLKRNTTGKVYCVFNIPDDTDPETASRFGRIAERVCDVPLITRPTTNHSRVVGERLDYEPIHQILDGFTNPAKAHVIPDRIAAIEWALQQAQAGDSILIAGQGAHPIAQLSDGRWQLTDREVCQSWLYGDSVPGMGIQTHVDPPAIFPIDQYRKC